MPAQDETCDRAHVGAAAIGRRRRHEVRGAKPKRGGQAIWELLTTSSPPFKALADSLEPERREELRLAWVDYFEQYRVDGGIEAPNEYMVILGRRTSEPVGSGN